MTTRAITALIDIMNDESLSIPKRIEGAAGLIQFQAPPEAVEIATEFLTSVFEENEFVENRLDALKLMRRFEAAKITRPSAAPADDPANREAWRRLEMARRRMDMIKAGLWPPEPGWADDLQAPRYRPPRGAGDLTDATNLGTRMERARKREGRKQPKLLTHVKGEAG